jgi:hypothetical protein
MTQLTATIWIEANGGQLVRQGVPKQKAAIRHGGALREQIRTGLRRGLKQRQEINNVSYRNPKERIHARPLYYGDNDDARNRPRSDIFRRRATWPCSVFV